MFQYALGFLLGSLSLLIVDGPFQAFWIFILSLIAAVLTAILTTFGLLKRKNRYTLLISLLIGVSWSNLAILWWNSFSNNLVTEPKVSEIAGEICSIPYQQANGWRFDICVSSIDKEELNWFARNRIRVNWSHYSPAPSEQLQAGQTWQLMVKLRPIHGRVNSTGFDYEKWLVGEGYLATASVKQKAEIIKDGAWMSGYQAFRQKAYNHFVKLLPKTPNTPLMLALLMGERSAISDEQWRIFQQSGTSHLLAISGLHIGIAALWSYWLVFFLWRQSAALCHWIPAQLVAEVASLIGAFWLVLLSGFGLPAQRALLMIAIFFVSRWRGRHLKLFNVIGWSLIAILIMQPFAVMQISFWLSFSAVLIIAIVLNRQTMQSTPWLAWFKIHWYLYIALIPLSWLFFGIVSWVALVANIVLIPATTFVLTPMLYIGALISSISESIAIFLFQIAEIVLKLGLTLQDYLADINSLLGEIPLDSIALASVFVVTALVLLPRNIVSRWCFLPLSLIFFLPGLHKQSQFPLTMQVFDVGQGLAVFLQTPEGNLLFDTAWGNGEFAVADSTLVPYFKQHRIQELDKLVISHADADHAGGVASVLTSVKVKSVLSGEPLSETKTLNCHETKEWIWSQVSFKFLNSESNRHTTGNNSSCVLSVQFKDVGILLTGDIERKSERQLLSFGISQHDILIAPHHGSETSSTTEFIKAVKPSHTIFSTGFDNQWRFPRDSVVERYRQNGSQIWITHLNGAITVRLESDGGLSIAGLRQEKAHFWR